MLFGLVGVMVLASTPANPELTGVDYQWVFPARGIMLSHHYDSLGHAHGFLPPNVSAWVNASHPLQSDFLISTMRALKLGNYRYPGGGQCDWWLWRNETFGPAASPGQLEVSEAAQAAFPPHALGVAAFADSVNAADAGFLLTLDVSRPDPASDTGVPALVAERLGQPGSGRGLRFEMGSEVYGPTKGFPQPGGFDGSPEYISAVTGLIRAAHALPGARIGVVTPPCPFVYPEGTGSGRKAGNCFDLKPGRIDRSHLWNRNLSRMCTERAAQPENRCDAVITHIYKCQPNVLSRVSDDQLMTAFLAIPQATIDNSVASLRRDYPSGTRLWVTEYNTLWEAAWHGAADAPSGACSRCRPAVGRFFNLTENSAAHAVHTAGYVIGAMSHGEIVEIMNYHSFFEGAEFHQPAIDTKGAGYYSAFVNRSGVYISAVAQMLALFSRWLRAEGATMEAVTLPPHAARIPFNLSAISLFGGPAFCLHATAICGREGAANDTDVSSRVVAVNRCAFPTTVPIGDACGGQSGWKYVESFNASLAEAGSMWARVTDDTPDDGPMRPVRQPGGNGSQVAVAPHSLSVVLLRK
jgi:hypothetical protein